MMTKTKLLGAAAALLFSAGAAAAAPAVSRQDLNVRSGPGTQYGVVGVIQAGATVDVGGCQGSWCQVEFDGGTGYANRSYLQMASAPSTGVVVQAPAYDPYDYDYDYGYSYGPGVSFYAGPRLHRHDGWRQGWHGRSNGWQGRNAGNWQGRSWQGRSWQGGDRQGARMGSGIGRGAQPGSVDSRAGARVSAPVSMPTAPAASAPAPSAPAAAAPAGGYAGGASRGR